jgi:DHA1 family tetracycline resistance protein-like MFS transporter
MPQCVDGKGLAMAQASRSDVRATIVALIPIYGITLIDVFGYMIMIPLLPYLAQKYGASGVEVGSLLATMAVASTVAAPVWGSLSDRVGRKPIVLISQFVSLFGYVALAFAPNLDALFISRGIAGIGGGNLGVTQSYIADVTPERYRDRAFAAFGAVFGLGIVLGPVTGGFLVHYGYGTPFLVAAGLETANILLTMRFLPQVAHKATRGIALAQSIRDLVKQPAVRNLVLRHFFFIFAVTYFFAVFALFVQHALGYGPQTASWLIAGCGAVGGITLVVAVGPLAKRRGDAFVAQLGIGLNILAYAGLGFAHTLWSLCVVLAVWAAGASCIEPTLSALIAQAAPKDERGAALGFNDAMSNFALMAAPSLGGFMIDRAIGLIGVIPGVALIVAFVLGLRPPNRAKADGAARKA